MGILNNRYVYILGVVLVLAGCNQDRTEKLKAEMDTLSVEVELLKEENARLEKENKEMNAKLSSERSDSENTQVLNDERFAWESELVRRIGPSIWRVSEFDFPLPEKRLENLTPEALVEHLNKDSRSQDLPEIALVVIREKTAFVKVVDDDHLTQSMGTSGAMGYIRAVAYTLASIKKIDCVEFEFSPGDHAFPAKICP